MRILLLILFAVPVFAVARPNIVLIIADDVSPADLSPYGNKGVRTPNLDRLAKDGVRFDRAFNACSSCSPSRASIITGRYPHSTGAERLHMPLPKEQVTFVERLRAAGYYTAAAGKWHLGPNVRDRFDLVADKPGPGSDGSGCEQFVPVLAGRPKDKPFFCWFAALDAHRPYPGKAVDNPHGPADVTVPPYNPDTPAVRADYATYYDEIARLDGYVGRVLAELERQGVLDDTLVAFISDNGRAFPRAKTTVYDSGIATPLIVRWPARVKAGGTSASLVSTVDLAPTFLELAGLKADEPTFQGWSFAKVLGDPGATYRPFVFAEHNWHDYAAHERAVRDDRYKFIRNAWPDLPGTPPADAVRSPTSDEMRRLRDAGGLAKDQLTPFTKPRPAEELYDTRADPHELRNLAADPAHAAALAKLRAALDEWASRTQDSVPATRPADGFDRETGEPLKGARRGAPGK